MEAGKKRRRPQLREGKYLKALLWNNITHEKCTETKGKNSEMKTHRPFTTSKDTSQAGESQKPKTRQDFRTKRMKQGQQ